MIGTLVRHETCARVFLLCFFENADLIVVTEHCIGQRRKGGTRFAFAQNCRWGVTSARLVGERFFFPPGYEWSSFACWPSSSRRIDQYRSRINVPIDRFHLNDPNRWHALVPYKSDLDTEKRLTERPSSPLDTLDGRSYPFFSLSVSIVFSCRGGKKCNTVYVI